MQQENFDRYIDLHCSPEPERLQRLYRHTHLHHLYPRMCSGHAQGRLLKMLTEMIAPQRILELGTFTGYSALCLAEGMPAGAKLHTVEIDDEMEDELLELFAADPRSGDITLHIGDAEQIVPTIDETWDLVYIDANKRRYSAYLDLVMPRLRKGGYILADNTLWSGRVADDALWTPEIAPETMRHDTQLAGIHDFNERVAADLRLEKVILPIRDGLTLIKKL